jgi:Tfp pilus assembly protein PilX
LSEQSGQALILVLVFLLLGSLMLVPALDLVSTGLKTGVKYEKKTDALYAADAGIEDGIWQIKYGGLQSKFGGESDYEYDFTTNASYSLENPVNGLTTNVNIQNIWIPSNITLADLGLSSHDAQTMIGSNKLVVSGTAGAVPGQPYRIKIDFVPAAGDNLTIKSVGVWLPQGFTFVSGNSTLEQTGHTYTKIPSVSDHAGGQAIVWSYNGSYPLFTAFPSFVSQNGTMTSTMYFSYTPPASNPTKMPSGIAWVTTEMHNADGSTKTNWEDTSNVPLAWDVDTSIYKITSIAGGTKVEAYTSKLELRTMGDAASGDYVAVGNSLMIDSDHKPPPDHGVRNQLLASSAATVSTIPSNGDVLYAYLYWSGWRNDAITAFSDTCSSSSSLTTNWVNGGDWAYNSNQYQGQHTGADSRRYLTKNTGQDLSSYPSGTLITLSWDQSVASLSDIFSDTCSSTNLANYWTNGGDWEYYNNKYQGQHLSGADSQRYLTVANGQNLSGYTGATVSWSQWRGSTALDSGDYLYFNISSDNGTTWSSNITAGSSANLTTSKVTFTYIVPTGYFTSGFKIRYYIAGFGSGKYCYLDDFKITPKYSSSDGLYFALYDGTSWGANIQAFCGPSNPTSSFSYDIPNSNQYLINGFKFRFYLAGMSGSQEYCYLDNIKIIVSPPDTSVSFSINGTPVSLDANGNPQLGGEVTASTAQVLVNTTGFSYACKADVSKLVKKYPIVPGEQHHTGNAAYTVGSVTATTGNEISYAGWSLVIVYFSPETAGHYLYLRDVFSYSSGNKDLDFDNDGINGGDISGFVIPEPIRDQNGVITETNAAHLTCFVGEGDWCYSGDFIAINAPSSYYVTQPQNIPNSYKLWDGITLAAPGTGGGDPNLPNTSSEADNVWNSKSIGMSQDGVDIDTFNITWASQVLKPGDTKLHLDLYSYIDNYNLVYLILSVRSKVVTGGTGHYIISDSQ